ncbi:MAG: hypothetical protein IJ578_00035 [Bacteroidales bacterium]|nr:hypothetical protein [Bacteroidales bacterium]
MRKEKQSYEAPLAELLPLRIENSILNLSQIDSGNGNDGEDPTDNY